jgi:hypothetical protein
MAVSNSLFVVLLILCVAVADSVAAKDPFSRYRSSVTGGGAGGAGGAGSDQAVMSMSCTFVFL